MSTAPQVAVRQGRLEGRSDGKGGAVFLGIPFAAPPVGALRWRAPRDPAPWHGVRKAFREPPSCPQNDYRWNTVDAHRYSEDCLYLDVHTPDLHPTRKMPVLVWIHGGSNRAGSAAGIVQTHLTRDGIVVVALQYRLGVLGFLSLPSLSGEQGGTSGNYGLMDQIKALRWVHDNIGRFGGDPNRVTISGQSSGAMDVGLLLLAHGTKTLFAGAWATGGTPGFGEPGRSLVQNEALGKQLVTVLDVPDSLSSLRAVPVAKLLAADLELHGKVLTSDDYLWLQAVVDGRVITRPPALSLAQGLARHVPYVMTTNRIELPVPGGSHQIARRLQQVFGTDINAAKRYYGIDGGPPVIGEDASYGSLAQRIGTDTDFRCPADHVLRMYAARGSATWRAQFSVEAHHRPSHHSAELPYLFDGLPLNKANPKLTIQAYFANFIKTENPNSKGLPDWPRFVPGKEAYVDFTYAGVNHGAHLGGPICRLVNGI